MTALAPTMWDEGIKVLLSRPFMTSMRNLGMSYVLKHSAIRDLTIVRFNYSEGIQPCSNWIINAEVKDHLRVISTSFCNGVRFDEMYFDKDRADSMPTTIEQTKEKITDAIDLYVRANGVLKLMGSDRKRKSWIRQSVDTNWYDRNMFHKWLEFCFERLEYYLKRLEEQTKPRISTRAQIEISECRRNRISHKIGYTYIVRPMSLSLCGTIGYIGQTASVEGEARAKSHLSGNDPTSRRLVEIIKSKGDDPMFEIISKVPISRLDTEEKKWFHIY